MYVFISTNPLKNVSVILNVAMWHIVLVDKLCTIIYIQKCFFPFSSTVTCPKWGSIVNRLSYETIVYPLNGIVWLTAAALGPPTSLSAHISAPLSLSLCHTGVLSLTRPPPPPTSRSTRWVPSRRARTCCSATACPTTSRASTSSTTSGGSATTGPSTRAPRTRRTSSRWAGRRIPLGTHCLKQGVSQAKDPFAKRKMKINVWCRFSFIP